MRDGKPHDGKMLGPFLGWAFLFGGAHFMQQWINELVGRVLPIDGNMARRMKDHLDQLVKPVESLGRLESLACQLAGIQATNQLTVDPGLALVFAGDHGIAAGGVSRYPQEVTKQMLSAYQAGNAALSVLARQSGIDVRVVDVGVQGPVESGVPVVSRKVAGGTRDFRYDDAMTNRECEEAMRVGVDEVEWAVSSGYRVLALGEVGIGNTASAAALAAALLGEDPAVMTGRGTGLDAVGWQRKVQVVNEALGHHVMPGITPTQLLAKLGGLEIAALVGAVIKAAEQRMVVVLDGYTTGVAALIASRIAPGVSQYCLASHQSSEPGHRKILGSMGWEPLLTWNMRLGEASGAVIAYPLLRQVAAIPLEMATFAEAGVSSEEFYPVKSVTEPQNRNRDRFSYLERRAVYRAIFSRRDIRQFRPEPIAGDILDRMLLAAHHGPSVGYSQPWDFIVVRDADIKYRLKVLADRERQVQSLYYDDKRQQQYLRLKLDGLVEAPVVIVVTADFDRGGPEIIGRHTVEETTLYSVACAVENLWLAARAEGVAVGWVSLFEKRHLRQLLGIPPAIEPVAVLCVGYTQEFPPEPLLKTVRWAPEESLTNLVHHNNWGIQKI